MERRIKPRRFDLNPAEFLSDIAGEMTPAELGVYWMICLLQYRRRGPIKYDLDWLRGKFASGPGLRVIDPVVRKLIEDGRLVREGDELSTSRVREEIEKATSRVRAAAEHGARGGRPSKHSNGLDKGSGYVNEKLTSTTTTTTIEEEESETLTSDRDSSESTESQTHIRCIVRESDVEEFWKTYPHRGSHADPKKPAIDKFKAKIKAGIDASEIIAAARRYREAVTSSGTDPKFIPQAVKWLNDERWRDEPVLQLLGANDPTMGI